ncbi:MAG: hypothetical protein JO075_06600, partial [Acidimicrobiia bacterium]|nr:hypothetical protein [Acidimicrobiia bacterium]
MDPEMIVLLPAAAVLAILGARRRAGEHDGATPGQQVEAAATGASDRIGDAVGVAVAAPSTAA